MVLVLILTLAAAIVGVALMIYMMSRDEPRYGVFGLLTLIMAGVASSVYGVLSSIETIP